MRKFIRHPVSVPIEVSPLTLGSENELARHFSLKPGGLAFLTRQTIAPGTLVYLKIPCAPAGFETVAKVVWCHKHQEEMALAVEFLKFDDAFKARMVEQLCHIEDYRRAVDEKEGRSLSIQEAAVEWIEKFAANFPNPGTL